MPYKIIWESECFEQLELFLRAGTRWEHMLGAARAADRELKVHPGQTGSAVAEGLRKIDLPPLRVFYEVEEPERIVRIGGLWWIGGGKDQQ